MTKSERIARDSRRVPYSLDGLPVGGWAETQQALRDLEQALPLDRDYTLAEYVSANYYVDSTGRYRSRAYQADLAQAAREAIDDRPEPLDVTSPDGRCTVRCAVDSQGMIVLCSISGEYRARDEQLIVRALPTDWLARARAVRAAVVRAADRGAAA